MPQCLKLCSDAIALYDPAKKLCIEEIHKEQEFSLKALNDLKVSLKRFERKEYITSSYTLEALFHTYYSCAVACKSPHPLM